MADHWAEGGKGAADVARAVVKAVDSGKSNMKLLYPDDMPLVEKIRTIAKEIYRARDIAIAKPVQDQLAQFEAMGFGKVPVVHRQDAVQLLDQPRSSRGRRRTTSSRCAKFACRLGRSSWWPSAGTS